MLVGLKKSGNDGLALAGMLHPLFAQVPIQDVDRIFGHRNPLKVTFKIFNTRLLNRQ
jgi:hypothetical protein